MSYKGRVTGYKPNTEKCCIIQYEDDNEVEMLDLSAEKFTFIEEDPDPSRSIEVDDFLKCATCAALFVSRALLSAHEAQHEIINSGEPNILPQCDKCHRIFADQATLASHMTAKHPKPKTRAKRRKQLKPKPVVSSKPNPITDQNIDGQLIPCPEGCTFTALTVPVPSLPAKKVRNLH
eukprot:690332_1